jgi:biopolymer transport protein ExbB
MNVKLAAIVIALFTFGLLEPASAYWNKEWTIRKEITIDPSLAKTPIPGPIGTVALLLRLHDGNFDFAEAKDDGSDIRFVASDDKTLLPYHIEKYDSLLNEAFVWVKVPDVKATAKKTIWLYYGNGKAPRAEDVKGTYDAATTLVYHWSETNTPPHDSTSYGNNAESSAIAASGSLIGPGARLEPTTSVSIPNSDSLAWQEGTAFTWSVWVKLGPIGKGTLLSRSVTGTSVVLGIDDNTPYFQLAGQRASSTTKLDASSWHRLDAVADGALATLYVDGTKAASVAGAVPAMTAPIVVGANTATNLPGLACEIDELEFSKTARSPGYLEFMTTTQGAESDAKLVTFAADEKKHSWFSGGFVGIILGSLTVDGWIVIGILAVMSVISWLVMISKARYIGSTRKGNAAFLRDWNHVAADLSFLDDPDARSVVTLGGRIQTRKRNVIRHSSVYRIYKIGAEEIRHRMALEGAIKHTLSGRSIQAIRASLDGGLVRETQHLNSLMVLLTIAISGGPFLGLLGTVVGVMITFAAIAAAGDVNVNAIAPGIAAALAATVAGLAVAIPALFGYNYLLSNVKNATSDMHVFIDEFVTKIAEYYGGRKGRPGGMPTGEPEDVLEFIV